MTEYKFNFPEPPNDERAREIFRMALNRPREEPATASAREIIMAGRALCEDTDEELALYFK